MKTITINNLAESTTEEVFEYIRHHLLTQMQQSKNDKGACFYKNEQGLKCAAGCLIPDDEYTPKFEANNWSTLVRKRLVPAAHSELIRKLQLIHDDYPAVEWKYHLDLLRKDIEEERFNESM